MADLLLALAQDLAHQALEGLRQGGIRDIPLVLVELARGKKAAGQNKYLVELIDDGGFADTRISRDEHQLGRAGSYYAIEGGEQSIDLACSPV